MLWNRRTFVLEPEIYGTGVAEEDDVLFVLDDGDALRAVWIVVPGAGVGIAVSAFEWDEFVGIVVDHGFPFKSTWYTYTIGRHVGALGSGGRQV